MLIPSWPTSMSELLAMPWKLRHIVNLGHIYKGPSIVPTGALGFGANAQTERERQGRETSMTKRTEAKIVEGGVLTVVQVNQEMEGAFSKFL